MADPPVQPASQMMVLLFTDLVGSVALKSQLGAVEYARIIGRHDDLFKDIVKATPGARIANDTGDGFLAIFPTVSDAVNAALRFQHAIRTEDFGEADVQVCIGIHLGEVAQLEGFDPTNPKVVGLPADLAARVMGLCQPGQILMTRAAFDNARQYVRKHPPVDDAPPPIEWRAHGIYAFKGNDEPMEVFEVGAVGAAPLSPPPNSEKAWRAGDGTQPKSNESKQKKPAGGSRAALTVVVMLLVAGLAGGGVWLATRPGNKSGGASKKDGRPANNEKTGATTGKSGNGNDRTNGEAMPFRPVAKRWALIVGVTRYEKPQLPALAGASSDARSIYNWLVADDGGRYTPQRVRLLTDDQATLAALRGSFEKWLSQASEDDLITVFFAGHGMSTGSAREKGSLFLTHDTDPRNLATTAFRMTEFRELMQEHVPARRALLIIDITRGPRNRPGRGDRDAIDTPPTRRKPKFNGLRIGMLYSGRSRSASAASAPSGLFARTLLDGLKGYADANNDGAVDLKELADYTINKVKQDSNDTMRPETMGLIDPRIQIAEPQ